MPRRVPARPARSCRALAVVTALLLLPGCASSAGSPVASGPPAPGPSAAVAPQATPGSSTPNASTSPVPDAVPDLVPAAAGDDAVATSPPDPTPSPTSSPTSSPTPILTPGATPGPRPLAEAPVAAAVWCPTATLDTSTPVVTGTVAGVPGATLTWQVTGAGTADGSVVVAADGRFAVPLALPAGSYRLTLRLAARTEAAGALPCTVAAAALTVPASSWESGASCNGVADGSFAQWRGSAVPIAGTWVDDNRSMVGLWQLQPGAEYATWPGDLDLAVGAIGLGETWAAAARGDYDERWRTSLSEMARLWTGHPGTLYIRFAHEFNGDWYPWAVTAATVADFRAAWVRYRALQQQLFPASRLVFTPNSETSAANGLDWRTAFPGAAYVDVVAVDYYNMWPWVDTAEDFARTAALVDRFGAPRGIQRHLEFARGVGLPFAVAEWGNNGSFGDSAVFVEQMHAFFAANAGTGPGRLRYEVLFNCTLDGNPYSVYPVTTTPSAAEAYRRAF